MACPTCGSENNGGFLSNFCSFRCANTAFEDRMKQVPMTQPISPEDALARQFHESYERLAPSFGYTTREASAVSWDKVPENNRKLMTAVCAEMLARTDPPVAMDEVVAVLEAVTERFAPVPQHLAQTWLKRARALLTRIKDSSK